MKLDHTAVVCLQSMAMVGWLLCPQFAEGQHPEPRATLGEFSKSSFEALAISPDGQWVAAARQGHIQVFERAKRKLTKEFEAHQPEQTTLCFSPDGKYLASGVAREKSAIRLWEVGPFTQVREIDGPGCRCMSFATKENILVTTARNAEVVIWNYDTGQRVVNLGDGHHSASQVAISPNGQTVASLSYRGVALWNANAPKGERLRMVITSTGKDTMTPSAAKQIRPPPQKVATVASSLTIYCLAFSPDGKFLACGGTEKKHNHVELWDLEKKSKIKVFSDPSPTSKTASITQVHFTPNGKGLLSCALMKIVCWNLDSGKPYFMLEEPERYVNVGPGERKLFQPFAHMDLSHDGQTLATAGTSTQIRLWPMPASVR